VSNRFKHQITPERYQTVSKDIAVGSEPGFRFYVLVAVSTGIACFGLISNSTAVVIGAMLVAPLMTPIFGISLALIRGDAVLMGFILGILYPALESTPEMLARTTPQLFDLLVAVLAGFAGSYAMVDEHISPALPGVAIATAIVPPLANTGLCFAVGAYAGGSGSFLLFFANFLSILLVSSFTFWFFGMTKDFAVLKRKVLVKRFGLPIFSFLLLAAFLTHTLYEIAQNRLLGNSIESTLSLEFNNLPATGMEEMVYHVREGKLYVLANVHSPRTMSPRQVKKLQERLSENLKIPTELIVRNTLAPDVTALGASGQIMKQNLDGFFITQTPHPNVRKTRVAEKIMRDYLSNEIVMDLHEVELLQIDKKRIVLATVTGFSPLSSEEIMTLEEKIQKETNDQQMELVVRFVKTDLKDKEGQIQFEWSSLSDLTAQQKTIIESGKAILLDSFKNFADFFLMSVSYTLGNGTYFYFLEVAGIRIFSADDVRALERDMNKKLGVPVQLNVWSRSEAVVTTRGYTSYEAATKKFVKGRKKKFRKEIEKILESSD
jgi:uncharacterized hydrophobic protein (TIGR00271 family)